MGTRFSSSALGFGEPELFSLASVDDDDLRMTPNQTDVLIIYSLDISQYSRE